MAYMTKNKMIYASNKNTQGVGYGYGGFRDSVEIPTGFSVGMGWVWALKFHPHGSPAHLCIVSKHLKIRPVAMFSVQCLIVFSAWSTTSRTGLAL